MTIQIQQKETKGTNPHDPAKLKGKGCYMNAHK